MNPHVQEEMAVVWSGGGRRYFTRNAALRGAAKKIIRDTMRSMGEVCEDPVQYQAWVKQIVGKIERGERPELDFDGAAARATTDGGSTPGLPKNPSGFNPL